MMQDAIKQFHTQFSYKPVIEQGDTLGRYHSYVLIGMGGSHLAADILHTIEPSLSLHVHCDYGLPKKCKDFYKKSLVILSSYSGNTEEVLEAYNEAKEQGYDMAVIAVGGKLIELAIADGISYVQLPDTGIQPRSALGFSLLALLALLKQENRIKELSNLVENLDPNIFEQRGKVLAEQLKDKVPLIYSSRRNEAIAYNWKIKLNETGKIPAFYNVFPELNHNEMTGFDIVEKTKHLSDKFFVFMLTDRDDHPRIIRRMHVVESLYRDRGLFVEVVEIEGRTVYEKIFFSLILADWVAVHIAKIYGLESEQVPMVEEFKSTI
jgi:glucose/mannose-6-phosphate isomerase